MSGPDEEQDPELEALGLGDEAGASGPRDGRSLLEIWDGNELEDEGLVYVVDVGDGYAVGATEDYSSAIREAEGHQEQEGTTEISISKYERVPRGLRLSVLSHFEGQRGGIFTKELDKSGLQGVLFGDGYDVSGRLEPYTSSETLSDDPEKPWEEKGVVWKWSMEEEEPFENWWNEQKESFRQDRFYSHRPKAPLSMPVEEQELIEMIGNELPYLQQGLFLYVKTKNPDFYRKAGAERQTVSCDVLSTRMTDAPYDDTVDDDGETFLVTLVVGSEIRLSPDERNSFRSPLEVPWVEEGGSNQYEIDDLGKAIGCDVDPKSGDFDPETVKAHLADHWKKLTVVSIRTGPDRGAALVFPDEEAVDLYVFKVEPR